MMNPNNFEFSTPDCHTTKEIIASDVDIKGIDTIKKHNFNTKIIIQLPDTPRIPDELLDSLRNDTQFYKVEKLPVQELVTQRFIETFIKQGKTYCVSCDTLLDIDNSVALTPNGTLHMIVDQYTYHSLAINGTLSKHILRTPQNRFVFRINTTLPSFTISKNYYEKVQSTLKEASLTFDMWISWSPYENSVCPSSIAKYFHELGYKVQEINSMLETNLLSDVCMPSYNGSEDLSSAESSDLLEWLGAKALALDVLPSSDFEELVSTSDPCSMNVCSATGFYSPDNICEIIQILRQFLQLRSSSISWISLTVYGHPDSAVSWGDNEHSFYVNGDNFYTVIIFKQNYWIYKVTDSNKPLRLYVKSSNN